jgi:hypothetical protein
VISIERQKDFIVVLNYSTGTVSNGVFINTSGFVVVAKLMKTKILLAIIITFQLFANLFCYFYNIKQSNNKWNQKRKERVNFFMSSGKPSSSSTLLTDRIIKCLNIKFQKEEITRVFDCFNNFLNVCSTVF